MSRQPRLKSDSGIYHVMLRGINKSDIFIDDEDYKKFLSSIYECKKTNHFHLFAYCLMSNHVHLLIKECDESISTIIKRIACKYVYWYNKKYERTGHLFQDRFRSEVVDTDEYFITVLRYIHQNPVNAKIVKNCGDYKYSSYKLYFIESSLIDKSFALNLMSLDSYQNLHQKEETSSCLDIQEKLPSASDMKAEKIYLKYIDNSKSILELNSSEQQKLILALKEKGLTINQICRLSGLKKWKVEKILYLTD